MAFNGVRLTGLWKNTSKTSGKNYLSGSLGAARLVVFPNEHKDSDKAPDFVAYLVPVEKKDENQGKKTEETGFPF